MNGGRRDDRWVAISIAFAAAAVATTQVRSYDLWWHLKAGEWIAGHLAVPRQDPFSFTSAGVPWVDHAWLWQIGAWAAHAAAGVAGLAVLKVACAIAIGLAAVAALRCAGWGPHVSSLAVLLGLAGSRFRIADRPETASLALLALFLFVLVAPGPRLRTRLLGSAATACVWANLHAGVLLAPVLAAAASAGSIVGALRAPREGPGRARELLLRARDEALTGAVAAAALLVNPYGVGLIGVPHRLSEALVDPRLVNPEWLPPTIRTFPLFIVVLVGAVCVGAIRVVHLKDPEAWRGLILAAVTGALGLTSARHIGVFFITLPFAIAAARPRGRPASPARRRRAFTISLPARSAPVWGFAASAIFVIWPSSHGAPAGIGIEPGRFPGREADYIERSLPAPRALYNEVAHGGYLIWRFFPQDRVFIDGRNEVHAALLREQAAALDDGRAWSALLDRHGVRAALVRYRPGRIQVSGSLLGGRRSWAALHFPSKRWALVYWGDVGMVFVKRGAGHDDLITRDEYVHVHPEDWEYQIERCRDGDADLLAGILEDLRRRVGGEDRSTRAADLLARFEGVGSR